VGGGRLPVHQPQLVLRRRRAGIRHEPGFSILPDFEPGDEDEDWWDVVEEAPQFGYLNIPVEDVPVDVRDPTVAAGENPYDELWSMGLNLNPENRAVTESFLDADPDWAITHHHQGAVVDPDSPIGERTQTAVDHERDGAVRSQIHRPR